MWWKVASVVILYNFLYFFTKILKIQFLLAPISHALSAFNATAGCVDDLGDCTCILTMYGVSVCSKDKDSDEKESTDDEDKLTKSEDDDLETVGSWAERVELSDPAT